MSEVDVQKRPVKRIVINHETGIVTCNAGENVLCAVQKELLGIETGDELMEFTKGFSSIDDAIAHIQTLAVTTSAPVLS